MTEQARFKQSDVTRAVKGVEAAGLEVKKIEIEPDGTITIFAGNSGGSDNPTGWEDE